MHAKVPLKLLALLEGKDILVGAIDVASDIVETPQEVAAVIEQVLNFVPKERIERIERAATQKRLADKRKRDLELIRIQGR